MRLVWFSFLTRSILTSGLQFDIAYTSKLKRAINTLNVILDDTNQTFIPVVKVFFRFLVAFAFFLSWRIGD
jgi:hypothetical protein